MPKWCSLWGNHNIAFSSVQLIRKQLRSYSHSLKYLSIPLYFWFFLPYQTEILISCFLCRVIQTQRKCAVTVSCAGVESKGGNSGCEERCGNSVKKQENRNGEVDPEGEAQGSVSTQGLCQALLTLGLLLDFMELRVSKALKEMPFIQALSF